ncbi:MAG: hypothetical protein MI739_00535, partial [Bacteroidales bacterium]|nr:hypothetical protein [Bacteroidales bacterium]
NNVRFKFFNYSNLEGYDFLNETPSFAGIFDMDKKRNYSIANFIMQKSNSEITINGAYSISAETFKYSTTNVSVNKQDVFFSSTYQHFFDKLSTKTGISIDYRENDSYGTKPVFYYAQDKNHPTMSFDSFESYLLPELFAYAKYKLTPNFIAGAGLRKNIKVNNEPDFLSYQGNLNYKLNKKHNINLSAGHYNKLAMPNAEQYEITHYKNNQIGLDYSFTGNWIKVQAAIFNKETNYQNSSSSVKGAEIYGKMNLNNLTLQMSFTSVDAKITTSNTTYPSKYNLNYFVRSSLKYNLNDIVEISAIYLFRQGCHYLPVISSKYIAKFDEHQPIYDVIDNLRRLPDYHKIDLSISRYWVVNTGLALVLYANVSNLLNTDNVQSVNYNYNYSKKFNELYSKRSFYFGINIMF